MRNIAIITGPQPATIKIFGQSDDLVELRGSIEEEFGLYGKASFLHFSDGTIIKAEYAPDKKAIWRLSRIKTGSATYEQIECVSEDADLYSDVVTLTGEIKCVAHWDKAKPNKEDFVEILSEEDWDACTLDVLAKVFGILAHECR